jgi:hypothetical protein
MHPMVPPDVFRSRQFTAANLVTLVVYAALGGMLFLLGVYLQTTLHHSPIEASLLFIARIRPGEGYVATTLPAVTIFGLGLATTVAPLTSTVLAAAESRHSGVASGINNAVARTARLLALAILPVIAGISGNAYRNADEFVTAGRVAAGGVIAWFTIQRRPADPGPRVGSDAEPDGSGPTAGTAVPTELLRYFCGIGSPDTGHCDPAPTT